ncbi:hemerythrin domain-containing protein [Psychrobacter sp. LV10R520-6]|uniref:hemerythrin domain-containing protein n=1 Tax=Psychrobacter sp. LV10R520-6 TaxID=1415574 RepID=UPI0024C7F95D|nr:hemerythrin domain-containing protein [Psychrobacter sp. LV10R520-6]SNT70403.1 Hemerythrin HHE cation binding domain-containing protein [Psychrobacter sp. LV10R520-6]
MKRANQLQPLSRQHHLGLHVGHHAKECADNPQEITEHWQALSSYMSDMRNHFQIEDNLIVDALLAHQSTQPDVASALETLEEQHKQLNALTAEIKASQENKNVVTVDQVRQLANLLYDHVRFEERELFPIVEKYLTEDELNAVYNASPDNIKHLDEQR